MSSRKSINLSTGRLTERNLVIAAVVKEVADALDRTSAQVALAWTLLHPAVVSPLIGARTLAQLDDNLAALDVRFDAAQIERLDAASRIELGFPHDLARSPAYDALFGRVTIDSPCRAP